MHWCILSVIYHSQFRRWLLVTNLQHIIQNSCLSELCNRYINILSWTITVDWYSSILTSVLGLTIWRRHFCVLPIKAGRILTMQWLSTDFPQIMKAIIHPEFLLHVTSIVSRIFFVQQIMTNRLIVANKYLPSVQKNQLNLTGTCIGKFQILEYDTAVWWSQIYEHFPQIPCVLQFGYIQHVLIDSRLCQQLVATVPDRHFGSGSGSKPNHCQIGGPGRQLTRTAHSGMVPWLTPNPSELGGLSAGHPAGPSIDSYQAVVFAVC
jgi:hypothetical protein